MSVQAIEAEAPTRGRGRLPGDGLLYTIEIADRICSALEKGEPLSLICKATDLPSTRTVERWAEDRLDFAARIAHARDVGWDRIANDTLAIADSANVTVLPDGTREERDASRDKLRVWTRLELLKRWDPKRYAESKKVEVSGGIEVAHKQFDTRLLPPEQRAVIEQVLLQIASENATPIIEGAALEVPNEGDDLV